MATEVKKPEPPKKVEQPAQKTGEQASGQKQEVKVEQVETSPAGKPASRGEAQKLAEARRNEVKELKIALAKLEQVDEKGEYSEWARKLKGVKIDDYETLKAVVRIAEEEPKTNQRLSSAGESFAKDLVDAVQDVGADPAEAATAIAAVSRLYDEAGFLKFSEKIEQIFEVKETSSDQRQQIGQKISEQLARADQAEVPISQKEVVSRPATERVIAKVVAPAAQADSRELQGHYQAEKQKVLEVNTQLHEALEKVAPELEENFTAKYEKALETKDEPALHEANSQLAQLTVEKPELSDAVVDVQVATIKQIVPDTRNEVEVVAIELKKDTVEPHEFRTAQRKLEQLVEGYPEQDLTQQAIFHLRSEAVVKIIPDEPQKNKIRQLRYEVAISHPDKQSALDFVQQVRHIDQSGINLSSGQREEFGMLLTGVGAQAKLIYEVKTKTRLEHEAAMGAPDTKTDQQPDWNNWLGNPTEIKQVNQKLGEFVERIYGKLKIKGVYYKDFFENEKWLSGLSNEATEFTDKLSGESDPAYSTLQKIVTELDRQRDVINHVQAIRSADKQRQFDEREIPEDLAAQVKIALIETEEFKNIENQDLSAHKSVLGENLYNAVTNSRNDFYTRVDRTLKKGDSTALKDLLDDIEEYKKGNPFLQTYYPSSSPEFDIQQHYLNELDVVRNAVEAQGAIKKMKENFVNGHGARPREFRSWDEQDRKVIEEKIENPKGFAKELQVVMDKDTAEKNRGVVKNTSETQLQEAFNKFKDEIERLFDHLYQDLDENPQEQSREYWDIFIHKPAQMLARQGLREILATLKDSNFEGKVAYQVINDRGILGYSDMKLTEALELMLNEKKIFHAAKLNLHDMMYGLQERVDSETMAKFTHLKASEVQLVLTSRPEVQHAYRHAAKILDMLLQDNKGIAPSELFTVSKSKDSPFNSKYTSMVKEQLRRTLTYMYAKEGKGPVEEWKLDSLTNLGVSIFFSATGGGLDRLAESKAPKNYKDVIASKILTAKNVNEWHFNRWKKGSHEYPAFATIMNEGANIWLQEHVGKLPEIKIFGQTIFSGEALARAIPATNLDIPIGGRKRRLQQWLADREEIEGRKFLYGLKGVGITENMNESKTGGIISRGSWRLYEFSIHLAVDQNNRPINPGEITDKQAWERLDFNKMWNNITNTGTQFMYHWAQHEGLGLPKVLGELGSNSQVWKDVVTYLKTKDPYFKATNLDADKYTIEDIRRGLMRDVLRTEARINPTHFLYQESPFTFYPDAKGSGKFGTSVDDMKKKWGVRMIRDKVRDKLDWEPNNQELRASLYREAELDCQVIADILTDDISAVPENGITAFSDVQLLNLFQGDQARVDRAKAYWNETRRLITPEVINEFTHVNHAFHYGTQSTKWDNINLTKVGDSVMIRVYSDEAGLDKSVNQPYMALQSKLGEIAASGDHDKGMQELVMFIHGGAEGLKAVHSEEFAREWSRRRAKQIIDYFDKSPWARLPLGLGTVLGFAGRGSLSQMIGGPRAWAWDEQVKSKFIADLHKIGVFTDEDVATMNAEVGARSYQLGYDVLRSVVPLVIGLIILAALTSAFKEEKQG